MLGFSICEFLDKIWIFAPVWASWQVLDIEPFYVNTDDDTWPALLIENRVGERFSLREN